MITKQNLIKFKNVNFFKPYRSCTYNIRLSHFFVEHWGRYVGEFRVDFGYFYHFWNYAEISVLFPSDFPYAKSVFEKIFTFPVPVLFFEKQPAYISVPVYPLLKNFRTLPVPVIHFSPLMRILHVYLPLLTTGTWRVRIPSPYFGVWKVPLSTEPL